MAFILLSLWKSALISAHLEYNWSALFVNFFAKARNDF